MMENQTFDVVCVTHTVHASPNKPGNIIGKSPINIIIEPEGVQQKQMDTCNFEL